MINRQAETEANLVAALRQGKPEAFNALYEAYAPVLLGVISRIIPHPDAAEEVLKETFVAIWSRVSIYDPSANRFLTWGLAIARGIALEAVKTGKYQADNQGETARPVPDDLKQLLQEEQRVREAFSQLEPPEKALLDLIYFKGYTCQQAATATGTTVAEIKTCLRKAFIHLGVGKTT